MLKGHTKIELTDVITGEVTTVEDDNIVTNFLQILFNSPIGPANIKPWELCHAGAPSTVWDTIHKYFRGLYLFDTPIEEDPNNIFSPGGARLTGCGCEIAYNGVNTTMGSYNATESGFINDGKGYKYVWDFSTTQANGEISCACLTTRKGGYVTAGSYPFDTSMKWQDITSQDNFYIVDNDCAIFNNGKSEALVALHFDANKNEYLIAYDSNEAISGYKTGTSSYYQTFLYKKALSIARVRYPFTQVSLFDTPYSNIVNEDMIIERATVSMPEGLQAILDEKNNVSGYYVNSGICFDDDEFLYIPIVVPSVTGYTATNQVPVNESIYVWKINVNDFSSTYFAVTNTTGEPLVNYHGNGFANYAYMFITSECTIARGVTTGKLYAISHEDNTNVTEIKFPDGTSCTFWLDSTAYNNKFENIYWDYQRKKIYFYCAQGVATMYVIDLVLKEISFMHCLPKYFAGNSSVSGNVGNLYRRIVGTEFLMPLASILFEPLIPGHFLSTINNLESPVTKTQSQTMKVTYTITKQVEEEE